MMFEHDHSAARGEMVARKLFVFKHKDALGNMPSHKLFERVTIERVKGEPGTPASGYDDYQVELNREGLEAKGVTVKELI
jgi:CRISPR-associated protein Csd2